MKLRLAGGVVTSDRHAWVSRPSGPARLTAESDAHEGAPVALGPADATAEQVRHAVTELVRLVQSGGTAAAGAGVDLGTGFHSARLAGARGDQRDAVFAALKVLGIDGAHRLGDRAGFLVSLFGPAATKRVGAAAARAIAESRWSALHLASAASDVLGPEQLEQILALDTPDGLDLGSDGPPSVLAGRLRRVLHPLPRPRRLELLVDLWTRVTELHVRLARRERLLRTQGRQDRVGDLRKRRKHYEDELVLHALRHNGPGGPEPSLADIARWVPPDHYWRGVLDRILEDAFAATALLRTAVAVSDHGWDEGLDRAMPFICAVSDRFTEAAARDSAKRVPGLTGLPARPGRYVRDIHRRMHPPKPRDATPRDARFVAYVRQHLALARDYALITVAAVDALFDISPPVPTNALRDWAERDLRSWRERIGYSTVRPPDKGPEPPAWISNFLGERAPLPERLAARHDPIAADVEVVGDLRWYSDLLDALAQLYGHDAAETVPDWGLVSLDYDPSLTTHEPLTPRLDSITLAISGAAQLVTLGAKPAKGAQNWTGFIQKLKAEVDIAETLVEEFSIPEPLAAVDQTIVPGTKARFQLARNARTLAQWSHYMGNCIASPHYQERAIKGRACLAALYDENNRILANAELRPSAKRGWRVSEIAARYNDTPDEALEQRFRRWVDRIPGVDVAAADPPAPDENWSRRRPQRRRSSARLLQDAGPALDELAERAWEEHVTSEVIGVFAALARAAPDTALTRLRRLSSGSLGDACRNALAEGALDLVELWNATEIRPLTTAIHALDPTLRNRFEQLTLLRDDAPLPAALRKLVRRPGVAPAYSMGLMARRIRRVIGQLAREDDQVLARAITRRITVPPLCALLVAVNCHPPAVAHTPVTPPRSHAVPGFPSTSLDDEPWQRAFAAARELGADTAEFWKRIAEHGLWIPTAWLGAGGWTPLWSRAHHPLRVDL